MKTSLRSCINCLYLRNKLPWNLAASSNKYVLSHSFCGSASLPRLQRAGRPELRSHQMGRVLGGGGLEVLLQSLAMWVSPQVSPQHSSCVPSERAGKRRHTKRKPQSSHPLLFEGTSYPFFGNVLSIRSDSLDPTHA